MAKKIEITASDEPIEQIRVSMKRDMDNWSSSVADAKLRVDTLKADLESVKAQLETAKAKAKESKDAYESAFPPIPQQ